MQAGIKTELLAIGMLKNDGAMVKMNVT